MRKAILWATLTVVLCAVNWLIAGKEGTLARGRVVLLRLAPVDPRSLMQGDYMRLRYQIANDVPRTELESAGRIVLALDENNVGAFVRVHRDGRPGAGECLLAYKNRGHLRLGTETFFFQEGDAEIYENAEYGELRVDSNGNSVLAGLRDKNFKRLK